MKKEVKMPKHGLNMTHGVIDELKAAVGDKVSAGDVLLTVETAKAVLEIESEFDGTVCEISVSAGDEVPVGGVIMRIEQESAAPEAEACMVDRQVKMPKHGLNMTSGTVSRFLVKPGDSVAAGTIIFEAETDKATIEVESPYEGLVKQLLVEEGSSAGVGEAVMTISVKEAAVRKPEIKKPAAPKSRLQAVPAARKLAREKGIDINKAAPYAADGVIDVAAVRAYLEASAPGAEKSTAGSAPPFDISSAEKLSASAIKRITAERITRSFQEVPHFYLSLDVCMSAADELREEFLAKGVKLSFNDFLLKACAVALNRHPLANSSFYNGDIYHHQSVNVGFATATPKGLVVPNVFEADQKPLEQIASERKNIVKKALEGRLSPGEMENGTFSISNLGVFGIRSFYAVVNPPQAAILSVGTVDLVPVLENGQLKNTPVMHLGLAVDHRVLDGSEAAQFFRDIKTLLESPGELL